MSPNPPTSHRSFRGTQDDVEHFITITAPGEGTLEDQIAYVQSRYDEIQKKLGLKPSSAIFRRIFLSDAINQAATLRAHAAFARAEEDVVAISIVQQPPQPFSKIALLAYHIESTKPFKKTLLRHKHLLLEKNSLTHLWSTQMCCNARAASAPEEVHTREVFGQLMETLQEHGASLKQHCARTWIFVKDVDVFYRGMVSSRRELFIKEGLSEHTHYIASTGIEGCCEHQYDLVLMDAYSILNMAPQQMSYLNDFGLLCPTKDYNVTFERGTRIAFADRAHHYISGTASIDKFGRTIYVGDVMRQLDRALLNIDGLLKSGGATIDDMMYMVVYLRDTADYMRVHAALQARFPHIPMVVVEGAVCRPDWLIEIEGVAAATHADTQLPSF